LHLLLNVAVSPSVRCISTTAVTLPVCGQVSRPVAVVTPLKATTDQLNKRKQNDNVTGNKGMHTRYSASHYMRRHLRSIRVCYLFQSPLFRLVANLLNCKLYTACCKIMLYIVNVKC